MGIDLKTKCLDRNCLNQQQELLLSLTLVHKLNSTEAETGNQGNFFELEIVTYP